MHLKQQKRYCLFSRIEYLNGYTLCVQKVIYYALKPMLWLSYCVSHYSKSLWKDRPGIMLPSSVTQKLQLSALKAVNLAYGLYTAVCSE